MVICLLAVDGYVWIRPDSSGRCFCQEVGTYGIQQEDEDGKMVLSIM
jgi:hypothetical protein